MAIDEANDASNYLDVATLRAKSVISRDHITSVS